MKKVFLSLIGVAVLATTAQALTLGEKKKLAYWNTQLEKSRHVTGTKKLCGVAIPAQIDGSVVTSFMAENTSASGYCGEVNYGINEVCKDGDMSQEAVSSSVKKVMCTLAEDGKPNFELKEGVLTLRMKVGLSNIRVKTMEFLNNNL